MSEQSERDEQIERLWESIFEFVGQPFPENDAKKHHAALEHIHVLISMLADPSCKDHKDKIVAWILEIFQLIAVDIGKPLMEVIKPDDIPLDRIRLLFLLNYQAQCITPTHRDDLDPTAVLLPRGLLNELIHSLKALNKGEVSAMLEPNAVSRHGDAYSWDLARIRAIEHVAFLVGQGVSKGVAQRRVAAAMRKVSWETLKSWEKQAKSDLSASREIASAEDAGRLSVTFATNPSFGLPGSGDKLDATVLAKLHELQRESLFEFGARYAEEFGQRHNSIPDQT
jgi:hypothetical protein